MSEKEQKKKLSSETGVSAEQLTKQDDTPTELTPTGQNLPVAKSFDEPSPNSPTAVEESPKKKSRKWAFIGALALVLSLGGWILSEQLNVADSGAAEPPMAGPSTDRADPESVRIAVESQRLVLTGNLKQGCAMYAVPQECFDGWDPKARYTFTVPPRSAESAVVPAEGNQPASTITVVSHRDTGEPDVDQRRAVLVRNTDHKVLDTEALGRDEAGMSLVQVGQQMRENS